ncbi:hypothetical protein [Thermaerobacter sp. PB12/4term]|nr:hypothetical protein [Thermaerobacter sp. PB12/4term]
MYGVGSHAGPIERGVGAVYLLAGLIALFLLIYLFIALLAPEVFE